MGDRSSVRVQGSGLLIKDYIVNSEPLHMDIVIVANSPGEIAGWVTPVVKEIVESQKLKDKSDRIIIFIPYCQYASGKEVEIAKSIPGVNYVFGPQEHLKFLFLNKGIRGGFSKKGILIHLGSDYFHSLLISRRLDYPAVAYTFEIDKFYNRYFKKFLVVDKNSKEKLVAKGINSKKIEIVGDLFVDSTKPSLSREEVRKLWNFGLEDFIIGIFPGSRPYQIKYMVPFFLRCAELVKKNFPYVKFILSKPVFISESNIRDAIINSSSSDIIEGSKGELSGGWIVTERGVKIKLISDMPYDAINVSDLIFTIPGTNTAQIATLGCPMVVVAPLNKPDEIPLDGIAGYMQLFPFFGKPLKKFLVKKFSDKLKWVAIPNSRARSEIVPEVRGIVRPENVVKSAGELITDNQKRTRISKRLKEVMGQGGAARKIADIVLSLSEGHGIKRKGNSYLCGEANCSQYEKG